MNNQILRALAQPSFLFLWLGELFTQIAINLFNFLLILLVYHYTQSNTAVSGIVLTFTVPAIVFGSIAGGFVDRWDKKKVLIASNISRAVLLMLLAFFHTNVVMIFAISILIALVTQFFIPAETPLIPHVVKPELLFSANALFAMGIYGSIIIAYVLSGPLILFAGYFYTLLILGLMLLVGALYISFIRLSTDEKKELFAKQHESAQTAKMEAIVDEIREALSIISRTKEIFGSLILLALSQIIVLIIAVIAPGYANQVLGIHVEEFPLLFIAPAAFGLLLCAIGIVHFFQNYSKEKMMTAGLFLSSFAMMFMPLGSRVASRDFIQTINLYLPPTFEITTVHILTVLAFFLGVANALVFVPSSTILQEKTSDEVRGKVYGILNTIVGIFSLIPIIVVGGLSDLIGVGKVIVGIGFTLFLLGISRLVLK
jgi:MFS family permease